MARGAPIVGAGKGTRPNPIDVHVGSRVRMRRALLGISQETLGKALGVSVQQVQKYEWGVNRLGASRLFNLSRILDVSIGFFFDDMPDSLTSAHEGAAGCRLTADPRNSFAAVLNRRESCWCGHTIASPIPRSARAYAPC